MRIIHDERQDCYVGKCEQCKREGVKVRRRESFGMFGESRGFYVFCFECIKPRITWVSNDGRTFETSVEMDEEWDRRKTRKKKEVERK